MPTTCEIAFENPEKVFYAGQLLRGTVRLTLTKQKKVRGVYVKIFGRAYAYWTEYCSVDHDRNRDPNRTSNSGHHVSYSGEEDYLNEKTYFVGGSSGELKLEPGTYNYTFQCMLPPGLPTSVSHDVGHIVYGASVILDIPMWPDKEFQENFSVIKMINLNTDPSFRWPAVGKEERVFYPLGCFCCCPSGPLNIEASTPVRGYTPGQTINVTVKVNNDSDEVVHQTNVELVKQITFFGSGTHDGRYESRTKMVDVYITGEETEGCAIGHKDTKYVNLRVPAIPPTDFSTSNVVHVKYSVKITGVLSGCCISNAELNLPITIGTYPILDDNTGGVNSTDVVITMQPTAPQASNENSSLITPNIPTAPTMPPLPNASNGASAPRAPSVPSAPIAPSAPLAPTAPSVPGAPIEHYPSEDPPTYEEAMATEGGGSNNFKPKYPMFRRQTSYSIEH